MANETIDYESLVKAKYPDAFIAFDEKLKVGNVYKGYFEQFGMKFPQRICGIFENEKNNAWEIAYNTLKEKNLL